MTDWIDEGRSGSEVDVAAMLDSKAPELIARCVAAGALIGIGTTSDGGALGVTVTLDGRWRREYFRESEEMCSWLQGAAEWLEATASRSDASTARRQRSRRTRDR
jgi:hypothetical protein